MWKCKMTNVCVYVRDFPRVTDRSLPSSFHISPFRFLFFSASFSPSLSLSPSLARTPHVSPILFPHFPRRYRPILTRGFPFFVSRVSLVVATRRSFYIGICRIDIEVLYKTHLKKNGVDVREKRGRHLR